MSGNDDFFAGTHLKTLLQPSNHIQCVSVSQRYPVRSTASRYARTVKPSATSDPPTTSPRKSLKRNSSGRSKLDDHDVQIIDEKPAKIRKSRSRSKVTASSSATVLPAFSRLAITDFEPKHREDLAVQPKKVDEVLAWIDSNLTTEKSRKVLLLTGPCGAGKTATVKVLCTELDIECIEYAPQQEDDGFDTENDYSETRAMKSFHKFLASCDYFSVINASNRHRVVIIEQLPPPYFGDSGTLLMRRTLNNVIPSTRCMFVFIMSSLERTWNLCSSRLFSPSMVAEMGITEIKFNPICDTIMSKALRRLFDSSSTKATLATIKQVTEDAGGDIRAAINSICFSSAADAKFKTNLAVSKNSLATFHFIGKVLYAKRRETSSQEWRKREKRVLADKWRRSFAPKEDVNQLVDICPMSGDKLVEYVFDHGPNLCHDVASCSRIFRDICEFDAVSNRLDMSVRNTMDKYITDIAIRSTLFHNHEKTTLKTMYEFRKPSIREVRKTCQEMKFNIIKLAPGLRSSDLFLTYVPLIPRTTFYLGPEEKALFSQLSFQNTTNVRGVQIKFNAKRASATTQRMQRCTAYLANDEQEESFEFTIEESDGDDNWF